MPIRRVLLAFVLVILASCGGSTTTSTIRTTPEGTRRARVLRADVSAPSFPALELQLRDDSLLIVRGGRRMVLAAEGVRSAELDFASPIVAVADRESSFLFLTADGAGYVVEGSDPLGRPTPEFSTSLQRLSPLGGSRGRLVVLAGDLVGDLYLSDGGELVKADLPPRTVLGATFTDETHGCALLFDGTGRYTDDGGSTFSVVAGLSHAHSLDLHGGSCRFHVGTQDEPAYQVVDERGFATDYEPGEDPLRDGVYPYRPAELFLARGSMARLGRSRALAIGPAPTTVQVFSIDDGRLLATHEEALPGACTLVDTGETVVAVCTPEEGEPSAWITRDGEHFAPFIGLSRVLETRGAQLLGSDDGQLAFTGPCEDDPAIASEEDTVCVIRDVSTGAHTSVMISDHGASAIRGIAGEYLLLQTVSNSRFWLAHLGTEETRDVTISGARRIIEAELASDGTLVVIADHDGGTRAVHVGPPNGELVRHDLPEGAVDASFQDREHGVAAGRTMHEIFRTRDGGLTWAPMRVALEGDATRTPLLDPERYLECRRNFCVGYSWRAGRGRAFVLHPMFEDSAPTTLASQGPDRLGDEPLSPLVLPTELRCEYVEGTTSIERPAPAPARTVATRVYGDGSYTAWVDAVRRGRRTAHQIHWSGEDAEGRYASSSRLADSNAPAGATLQVDVISAARTGALLNLCFVREEARECQFAIVNAGGVPLVLQGSEPHIASHGMMVATYSVRDLFFAVVPRATGPMVFLFDPAAGGVSSFDVGEAIGEAFVGIANTSIGPYFVLTNDSARLWNAIVEQGDSIGFPPFAAITDLRISSCRDTESAATTRWPGRIRLRIGEEILDGSGFAEIGLSSGPACVRRYVLATDPVYGRVESNAEGQMIGFVDKGEEGLRNIRCSLR